MSSKSHNRFSLIFLVLTFILALSFSAVAQEASKTDFSHIKIKNFGQMDERFFRGAQPKEKDYAQLAALGIKTVIDLREDPTEYEKSSAEAVGMRYVNIPMVAKRYPDSSKIEEFLKLANNPETGKFFVHCAGGRHRTGVVGAVWRFNNYKWTYDQVYAEMKQFDFYTRWGHGDMKKFVQDYAVSYQKSDATATQTSVVK
jgi:protein tyrosine/serine phosphatase